ncbi:RagB/SusD family nutrient uptake outer membrane protein [Algibacter agarivorans]|uniref:RagB/SusD family nutrient uptake outer membrane protein n=1 Tax=Algibacter agarivorans TaxID=1109741 RepID=A0ABP9GA34_9FLAO
MKKYLLIIVMLTFAFSCTTLEEEPKGLLTPSTYYKTQTDLDAGVSAIYRPYMEFFLNAQGSIPTLAGDDVTTRLGSNKGDYREFDQFQYTAGNGWLQEHGWNHLFRTIFYANAVISNYTNAPEGLEREQAVAQAFFLRGWAYFQLVRTFGPVPLVTTDVASGEEPRSPESDVYDQVIKDLDFATENLPDIWPGEPGRPTVWAAKFMLAKVYLTTAGWPLKNTANYAKAAGLAKDVIDNSGHDLMPVFRDLWLVANDNNVESVLAVQADNGGDWGLSNRMPLSIGAPDDSPGNGWDDYFAEIAFFNEFPEGPRKDDTFRTSFAGGSLAWEETIQGNPYYSKLTGYSLPQNWQNSLNPYVLRFADVLLMYAEAQNKADGNPNGDAYDALNKVRRRAAGVTDNSVDLTGLNSDEFHKAVIAEAGWEFAGEWHRWYNLVRNEMVAEATGKRITDDRELPLIGASAGSPESAFQKFYYAPIPLNEMLLRPDWDQNPCCN